MTTYAPLAGMQVAVTRQMTEGDFLDAWMPEERITVEQALAGYTSGVAFQAGDVRGGTAATGRAGRRRAARRRSAGGRSRWISRPSRCWAPGATASASTLRDMPLTPGEADRLLLHLAGPAGARAQGQGTAARTCRRPRHSSPTRCASGLATDSASSRRAIGPGCSSRRDDVLPGVPAAVGEIRVEARFDDGTRLVVVKDPFAGGAATPATPDCRRRPAPRHGRGDRERGAGADRPDVARPPGGGEPPAAPRPRARRSACDRRSRPGRPSGSGRASTLRLAIRPIAGDRVVDRQLRRRRRRPRRSRHTRDGPSPPCEPAATSTWSTGEPVGEASDGRGRRGRTHAGAGRPRRGAS